MIIIVVVVVVVVRVCLRSTDLDMFCFSMASSCKMVGKISSLSCLLLLYVARVSSKEGRGERCWLA